MPWQMLFRSLWLSLSVWHYDSRKASTVGQVAIHCAKFITLTHLTIAYIKSKVSFNCILVMYSVLAICSHTQKNLINLSFLPLELCPRIIHLMESNHSGGYLNFRLNNCIYQRRLMPIHWIRTSYNCCCRRVCPRRLARGAAGDEEVLPDVLRVRYA